jgi:hypothetical protein
MTTGSQLFTEQQRQLLTAALNRIIPGEGQLPGAGDLGIADFVEQAVAGDPGLRRLFTDGLAQIEIAGVRRDNSSFEELSDEAKEEALREVETNNASFFENLVRQCYNGYYTHPQIFDLIGYSLPNPSSYQPKPFEEDLLEPQRGRAPFWRQV